ncbi:MAG: hypothetical protein KDC54_14445, partial [Lewinella sp.]|nr:hypothetical protein [Lewinella sp.]
MITLVYGLLAFAEAGWYTLASLREFPYLGRAQESVRCALIHKIPDTIMSLKNDLKRIFFGAKSVAKSAADKAKEAAEDTAEELQEKGGELMDKAKQKAKEWGEDLKEGTAEARTKAREAMDDLGEKVREEASHARERGEELKKKAEAWLKDGAKLEDEDDDDTTATNFAADADPEDSPADATTNQEPIDFEEGLDEPKAPRKPSALEEWGDQTLDKAARTGAKALDRAEELGGKV